MGYNPLLIPLLVSDMFFIPHAPAWTPAAVPLWQPDGALHRPWQHNVSSSY